MLQTVYTKHGNLYTQAFEDGPDRGFQNVGQYKSDAGDTPKN
jgi:hypothetical protein